MNNSNAVIKSHTGFQPLEEVWVGDCYPPWFSDAVAEEHRDLFLNVNEQTKQDLNRLVKKLKELNVIVRRPEFNSIEHYTDDDDNLLKPPITPRDWALTLDDTLYITPQYTNRKKVEPFQSAINLYKKNNQKVKILDRRLPEGMHWMEFPSTVRVGRDLFIDTIEEEQISSVLNHFAKDYRVHIIKTGGHADGVFCPISPGHIFSTHYLKTYNKTFPNWEIYFLADTTGRRGFGNGHNGKWWLPGVDYSHYNNKIFKFAKDWLGDSRETIFEVNMLIIDEKNVLCIAEDDGACRKLESLGITPHVIDFKTRGFWDGGIHCLTLDIRRKGDKLDYWPGRGENGIYYYDT